MFIIVPKGPKVTTQPKIQYFEKYSQTSICGFSRIHEDWWDSSVIKVLLPEYLFLLPASGVEIVTLTCTITY